MKECARFVVGFQPEEIRRIPSEQLLFCLRRKSAFPDQLSNTLFPEREWIVRTQHHVFFAHRIRQELQRRLIENGRIHIKAVEITLRRKLAHAACHRMMMPCVFQAPEQEGKTSATVRKADTQVLGQSV